MFGICYEIVKGDFYDKIFHLNEHRQHISSHVHPNHQLLEPSRSKIQLISGHVDYSHYYQSETLLKHTNFLLSLSAPSSVFVLLCGITVELDELASLHGFFIRSVILRMSTTQFALENDKFRNDLSCQKIMFLDQLKNIFN